MTDDPRGLPAPDPVRLADALASLADGIDDVDLRAQLHAAAGIVHNLVPRAPRPGIGDALAALQAAEDDGDDDALVDAIERVAAIEGEGLRPVDWTAASGG